MSTDSGNRKYQALALGSYRLFAKKIFTYHYSMK